MKIINIIMAILSVFLVSCSSYLPKDEKLSADHSKLENMAVLSYLGNIPDGWLDSDGYNKKFPNAFKKRLPDFFEKNGISVTGYYEVSRPLANLKEVELFSNIAKKDNVTPSHIFIITAQNFITYNNKTDSHVKFEFVLYDTKLKKLIWKRNTTMPIWSHQPNLRVESLVANTLKSFNELEIYSLPNGKVINMDGEEWSNSWVYTKDK